eukprot:13114742-Ditylum_brightwellii.AAC.1
MMSKYNPDMPTYWQASFGDKAKYWFEVMNEETDNLTKCNAWTVILPSKIGKKFPLGKIIATMWALKKKRNPDMTFKTYKGCFCVHGDPQRKHTNVDSFVPVVSWTTIKYMLVQCCFLKLVTISVDFSNAFAQAGITEGEDVYIPIPQGYKGRCPKDTYLCLNELLYGKIDATRLWYKKLKAGLEA